MKSITSAFLVTACILFLPHCSPATQGARVDRRPDTSAQTSVPPHAIPSRYIDTEKVGPLSDASSLQDQKAARLYVIRVIDSTSRDPISHAKVWVEIGDLPDKRNGYTDARGAFTFTWRLTKARVKTHISVAAAGYPTIDDFGVLTEERLIQLSKSN